MGLLMTLRRLASGGAFTVHGFASTLFGGPTSLGIAKTDAIEAALAHAQGTQSTPSRTTVVVCERAH